ncbi:MAG TPA: hypothetical protein VFO34_15250 [Candidatus Acidoferrales bacterium]|nr:hypothetical protein [Candidatus Acidoferrales bacterium]
MKRLASFLLVASLVAIPTAYGQKAADSGAQDDAIREAVFRYQFRAINLQAGTYFLAVDGKNPSDALLARFRDNLPVVKGVSDSRVLKKPVVTIVDKKNEQQGVLFHADRLTLSGGDKADAEGGYECGDLCEVVRGTYHLVKDADGWVVKSFDASPKSAKSSL